jgi:hypothetical protein
MMSSQDLEIDDMPYPVPELAVPDLSLTVPEKLMLVATIGLGIAATVLAASLIAPLL